MVDSSEIASNVHWGKKVWAPLDLRGAAGRESFKDDLRGEPDKLFVLLEGRGGEGRGEEEREKPR